MTCSCLRSLAQSINADVRRDPIEPALQCGRIAQGLQLTVGANESLLSQIFGLARNLNQVPDVSNDPRAIWVGFKERR